MRFWLSKKNKDQIQFSEWGWDFLLYNTLTAIPPIIASTMPTKILSKAYLVVNTTRLKFAISFERLLTSFSKYIPIVLVIKISKEKVIPVLIDLTFLYSFTILLTQLSYMKSLSVFNLSMVCCLLQSFLTQLFIWQAPTLQFSTGKLSC